MKPKVGDILKCINIDYDNIKFLTTLTLNKTYVVLELDSESDPIVKCDTDEIRPYFASRFINLTRKKKLEKINKL